MIVIIENFHDLSIYNHSPTKNTQYREKDNEGALEAQRLIEVIPDKKTKDNAAGHGQPHLHHQLEMLHPRPVVFVFKKRSIRSFHNLGCQQGCLDNNNHLKRQAIIFIF